jgi:hypothetical protein
MYGWMNGKLYRYVCVLFVLYMYVCSCGYTRVSMYGSMYVHMYVCRQTCIFVCVHVYIYVTYVCMYVQGMTVSSHNSSVKAACSYLNWHYYWLSPWKQPLRSEHFSVLPLFRTMFEQFLRKSVQEGRWICENQLL